MLLDIRRSSCHHYSTTLVIATLIIIITLGATNYIQQTNSLESGPLDPLSFQLSKSSISNRPPIFDRNNYDASIPEGKDKDYPVVNVSATDLDGHELTFILSSILEHRYITTLGYQSPQSSGNGQQQLFDQQQLDQQQQQQQQKYPTDAEFKIDPKTGVITTTKPLDRERVSSYTLILTVTDNGQPRQSDTAKVIIDVTDINDSPPVFTQSNTQTASDPHSIHHQFGGGGQTIQLSQNISESVPIYTPVLKVHAIDSDTGLNAQLRYTFAGGNDCDGTFTIDQNSGVVRTNKLLDRETHPRYELVALAVDRGQPPLSGSVAIQIYVDDVNDNAPQWLSLNTGGQQQVTLDKLTYYITENVPIGTKVAELQATDLDEGENSRIQYEIIGGVDARSFNLVQRDQPDRAELITMVELNYESAKNKYHLIVRASSMSLKSDIDLEILVTDENDNKPQLDDFSIILNNYRNHFPNTPIGKIPAYDADATDQLRYKILTGNNAHWLIVNETSGDIQLSPSLNSNVPMRALFDVTVSDGQNEVSAQCLLVVNLVTDTMLQNSVIMRLDGIGRDEFLTHKYDTFIKSLAHILACQADGIVLFDVQEYQPSNGQSSSIGAATPSNNTIFAYSGNNVQLNVSFSVRSPDNRDAEAYYSGQYLQERIYLNRPLLTQMMGLQVLPFENHFCVQEPCLSNHQCQETYKFGNASKTFISTRTMLFRPITPELSYNCECPQSFTGMNAKYECDVEINQCFSNPCQNGGTCHRHELGYSCECRPGYIGLKCELSFVNSSCQSIASYQSHADIVSGAGMSSNKQQQFGMCSGGTKCVNLDKTSLLVPPQLFNQQQVLVGGNKQAGVLATSFVGGFKCQGCQAPAWSNELCQLRARSFSRGSYLTLPSLRQRNRLHLSLKFATRQTDALLLYNGRYNDKNDFIALELVDSRLRFSFSLGSNVSSVSLTKTLVSDGNWHKVSIDYLDKQATLTLDDCDPILDQALAKLQYEQQQQQASASASTEAPNSWSQSGEQSVGTTSSAGALSIDQQIQINAWRRCSNTTQMELESRCNNKIERCHRFLDLSSPLQIGALPPLPTKFQVSSGPFTGCISDLNIDYQFIDLNQYVANNGTQAGCQEKRSFCHAQPCQNGGTCHDAWSTYRCSCPDGYNGHDCSQSVANQTGGGVMQFGGNSYMSYVPNQSQITLPWSIKLNFRTIQPNGALIRIHLEPVNGNSISVLPNIMALDIVNGGLRYVYQNQMLTLPGGTGVDDGQWHMIEIKWSVNGHANIFNPAGNSQTAQMILDYGQYDIQQDFDESTGSAIDITNLFVTRVIVGAASTTNTIPSSARLISSRDVTGTTGVADGTEPILSQESSTYYNTYNNNNNNNNQSSATTAATTVGTSQTISSPSFRGCIQVVDISGQSSNSWLLANKEEKNVELGCHQSDTCSATTCMDNASCVQYGMSQHKCICQPGYVAAEQGCVPVCSLNPCHGIGSKCRPLADPSLVSSPDQGSTIFDDSMDANIYRPYNGNQNLGANKQLAAKYQVPSAQHGHFSSFDSGYKCECDFARSGKYCEHQLSRKCPSNWWGHPVSGGNLSMCGPCQCDETKGFDGDCHKTTGQCFCKQNHYQPEASDQCLPCDCYTIGSLGSQCHPSTGQCKCRPGVIGRRCDTCPSPYAEVTLRGCDVIYDACPRSYSDGVWWDKTPFKQVAIQPCPHQTFGNASRVCDEVSGWQKADLFNCVSSNFNDLYTQLILFERDQYPLNTVLAIKLANNLRQALNQTVTRDNMQNDLIGDSGNGSKMYGSDMFVAFRLLYHLIHYETHQNGLNLSHKQDRMYIRNLVESTSYLLDPKYADHWLRIAKISPNGGAEQLLKMFDQYGRTLIENKLDTFTQPFEVASKYFTFGMDTIATDQLWDFTRTTNYNSQQDSSSDISSKNVVSTPSSGSGGGGHFNADGSSIYLDYSIPGHDATPAVVIPKYDNYAPDRHYADEITRAIIPLKALKIKISQERPQPMGTVPTNYYQIGRQSSAANYRAKRDLLTSSSNNEPQSDPYRLPKQPAALVVYSIYQTLGALLPGHHDGTVQHRLGTLATTNSPVVWLTMKSANSTEFMSRNLQPKVSYILKTNENSGKTRPQCVVWNFTPASSLSLPTSTSSSSSSSGGSTNPKMFMKHHQIQNQDQASSDPLDPLQTSQSGRFSARGCEVRGISPDHPLRFRHDYINCTCDHLGAVTVLMDDANIEYLLGGGPAASRDIGLQLSLIISIIILSITCFIMTCIRGHSINSNSNSINRNLVLIIITMEALILLVSRSRAIIVTQHEYQCKMVAIFLHYLSISLFCWLFINGTHLLRMLTEIRDINHGPMKFYHIIGFAVPAIFVSIAVGLRIEQFGNYLFCWLSIHESIIWSMFGPIVGLILATIITLILSWRKSQQIKETVQSDHQNLRQLLWTTSLILMPLITAYWLAAIYSVNEALLDYPALFPTLAIVKSVVMLVVFCLLDKHIRYNLYVSCLSIQGKKIPLFDCDTHSSRIQVRSSHLQNNAANYLHGTQNTLLAHPYGLSKPLQASGHMGTGGAGGFQSSCTDIFNNQLAISTASTTSRSTTTNTSSSPYQVASYAADQTDHLVDGEDFVHSRRDHSDIDNGAYERSRSKRHRNRRHHHHRKSRHHHHHHHHRSSHHRDQRQQQIDSHLQSNQDNRLINHQSSKKQSENYAIATTTDGNESMITTGTTNNVRTTRGRKSNYDLASSHSSDEDDMSMVTGNNANKTKRQNQLNSQRTQTTTSGGASLDNIEEHNQQQQQQQPVPITSTISLTASTEAPVMSNYASMYGMTSPSNPYGIVRQQDNNISHYSHSSMNGPSHDITNVGPGGPAPQHPPPIQPKPKFYQSPQKLLYNDPSQNSHYAVSGSGGLYGASQQRQLPNSHMSQHLYNSGSQSFQSMNFDNSGANGNNMMPVVTLAENLYSPASISSPPKSNNNTSTLLVDAIGSPSNLLQSNDVGNQDNKNISQSNVSQQQSNTLSATNLPVIRDEKESGESEMELTV